MCLSLVPSPVHTNTELVSNRECIIEELLFSCETPKILSIHRWANQALLRAGKKKSKQQKNQKKPNTLYIEIQSKYRVNIKSTSKSYPEIWWSSTETVEIQPVFLSSLGQKERFPHLPRKQNFKYSKFKKRIILFLLKFLKSLIQGCLPLEAPQIKSLLS